jgi:hypothetical protein
MNTTNLRRRLEALEEQLTSEPVLLLMPDGRTETLPGHNDYVLNLLSRAVRGDRTLEMELVARSVSSIEPGGAHMVDLVRALLNGPVEAEDEGHRQKSWAAGGPIPNTAVGQAGVQSADHCGARRKRSREPGNIDLHAKAQ